MDMKIFLYIVIGMTMLASIFLSFIMKRILKNMDEDNILIINFLICHVSDLLFMANIGNCLSFFFFMGREALDFLKLSPILIKVVVIQPLNNNIAMV